VFTLTDGSGQDARFYGRRADHECFAGKIQEALALYQRAYRAAVAAADPVFQYKFLNNIGACQLALFRYHEAEQTLLKVRRLARAAHDDLSLGSTDSNLAALYAQMKDDPAAEIYARESVDAYSRTDKWDQRSRVLLTLADILSREDLTPEAEESYRAGIGAAVRTQDWFAVSAGWLHYGQSLLQSNRLEAADAAFANSYSQLHKSKRLNGEDAVLWNLSKLRLRQHDPKSALTLMNRAIKVSVPTGGRIPAWRLYQTRAQVELEIGDNQAALKDARVALQWARALRANIIPDNDNRIGTESMLDPAFSVLIEAGNRIYLKTGDPALLRETFEAVEENRAQSLEALLPAFSNWRAILSTAEYQYKLSLLVQAQRAVLRVNTPATRENYDRLQTELSQMEADAGAAVHPHLGTVLDRVRKNLPPGSALLSFLLGDRASWLWSVHEGKLHLYQLPPKRILLPEIRVFQDAIKVNDTRRITEVGHRLYLDLFGGRGRSFEQSSQWFISLDESLYTLDIPSLTMEVRKDRPLFLTERKTLQVIPGAQLLHAPDRGGFARRRFLLAGDGIYNRADPRGSRGYVGSALVRPASWGMARLPGSGAEVKFAADLWHDAALLTGPGMTKDRLLREMDRDPDVIHIASHVIEGHDRWHTGILALRMDPSGEPELLTPREIQLRPLHSRLVVMSGCSSGTGKALPASGLMGLTRAWLAAGTGAVLATRWPTMDESGDGLIGSFYLHLLASRDGNIPEALREARRDMIARGGWRAEPRYWSSFFLIGVR
jgi:CHAT domain-containing protein